MAALMGGLGECVAALAMTRGGVRGNDVRPEAVAMK
jgi:hypothetical protein